jgi:AAA+ ATPase superfamily predicted ATPase
MNFLDRQDELARLDGLARRRGGGLAIVYGRRRVGKTRLLLEWSARHGGAYTVADQSAAAIQRRYFAGVIAERLPGFADVEFPEWRSLLSRLARDAAAVRWRGPIVLDEFPYLVLSSPELPSVLQRWIEHDAADAKLVVALAGSSQRMMQGLVLPGDAPLYGRAREILDIRPLEPGFIRDAFGTAGGIELAKAHACWGGVPRYWELACEERGDQRARVDRLVLDPLGPLHREPDRLLLEEVPSAAEVRPVLDAIGAGAHRLSEIGARMARPATSLSRPIKRLLELGLARREVPFGDDEKSGRRSLYKIDDPFFRLWFRVVAPQRGRLASASREGRLTLLDRFWPELVGTAWEDLCRVRLPRVRGASRVGRAGPWGAASRWWSGSLPEWDLVAESIDGRRLLIGEAKWSERPVAKTAVEREARRVGSREAPALPVRFRQHEVTRALFVPELRAGAPRRVRDVLVVTCADLVA